MKKIALLFLTLFLTASLFSAEIGLSTFNDDFLDSLDKPTIITFGESWCQPCLRMIPYLNRLQDSDSTISVYYVDLEKTPEAFSYIPITATPTTAFYLKGGVPFSPKDPKGYQMYSIKDTGEHVLTLKIGLLSLNELRNIAKEMKESV